MFELPLLCVGAKLQAWCIADGTRRGYGEDGIYFDHQADRRDSVHHRTCAGRWRGVDTPRGQDGRPSQSPSLEQASALLKAAEESRLHAFIVLCLLRRVRSEEARALTWNHVDLDAGTNMV
jgi:integrase